MIKAVQIKNVLWPRVNGQKFPLEEDVAFISHPVACIKNDVTIVNYDASVVIFTPLFVSWRFTTLGS